MPGAASSGVLRGRTCVPSCSPPCRRAGSRPICSRPAPAFCWSTAPNSIPSAAPAEADTPLLAALATGAYTEPPLLRALRLALPDADIGSEYDAWNHPGVIADELACTLRPTARDAARQVFQTRPAELRQTLQALRDAGNAHLSPLVRLEERLTAGPGGDAAGWWNE